jgi:nitrogenase molybdenum-iron protein NifN
MLTSEPNEKYTLNRIKVTPSGTASQNACKLCAPLGAALVFKGIRGAVPLLHGSQGCSTYIRRYLISHFREPIDIACSNFGEQTAIFGGGANMKLALDNIIAQYDPEMIGVATTCLAETIGDDVPMFIAEYHKANADGSVPPIVHVATPSYQGTHMQGFHNTVLAVVRGLARGDRPMEGAPRINLFPGMVSPADLRLLKQIVTDFGLEGMLLPDYSQTLDGGLWSEYHRIPAGGTAIEAIAAAGSARASIELGGVLAKMPDSAADFLEHRFSVPAHRLGLPIGIRGTDRLLQALAVISGRDVPAGYAEERGRLLDALVDGHKYVNNTRAVVYGEADLVAGLVGFLAEIGVLPVICATGDGGGHLADTLQKILDAKRFAKIEVMEGVDFVDIEAAARKAEPDLIIGHSKGYSLSRKLNIPLIRIGFPIHDRMGGGRLLHVGYQGAMALFDRIANAILEHRQSGSEVGYTYM